MVGRPFFSLRIRVRPRISGSNHTRIGFRVLTFSLGSGRVYLQNPTRHDPVGALDKTTPNLTFW
jgi:hypothetical protein